MTRMATIKRVYIPYTEWEDWLNGMWSTGDESRLQEAIDFTGDHIRYGEAMREVVIAWPRTMLNSLTNTSINRRAFLGHCAVCYKLGIQESIVRSAWKELTDEQRFLADDVAEKTIKHYLYETRNSRLHKDMGKQMLFEWAS